MTRTQNTALKFTAVLWVIWGLVHTLAGVMTIIQARPNALPPSPTRSTPRFWWPTITRRWAVC